MHTFIKYLIEQLNNHHIKTITILGHDHIDEDSCISGILMEHLLNKYGINARFKILDAQINDKTLGILKKLGYDMTNYQEQETTEEEYLLLVDHYTTTHKGKIIGCIDHHPTSREFEYLVYENDRASACCKKVYDYMVEEGVEISESIIACVVYGLMMDTFAFKSSRGTKEDELWVQEMIEKYHLDYEGMYKDALSLTDLNRAVEEVAMTNLKSYEFNSYKVKSTYIQVDEEPEQLEQLLEWLMEKVKEERLAMWVFLLVDVQKIATTEYRITSKDITKISHPSLTSRAQGIMPHIEKLFTE